MSSKKKTTTVVKTEAVKKATVEKTEAKKVAKNKSLVYLGPSIPDVVRHSNVFMNGYLPEKVLKAIDKTPALRKLFVPVGEVAEANKELGKASVLANIYRAVAKEYNLN